MPFASTVWFPSVAAAQLYSAIFVTWLIAEVINTGVGFFFARRAQRRDRGSYWMIYAAIVVTIACSYFLRAKNLLVLPPFLQYLGIVMMGSGIVVREWAILTLGRAFSTSVQIKSSQHLVTRGLYRWLRHPSYTGSLLTLAGVPLALGTLAGLIVTIIVTFIAYSYRVRVEEQALLDAFGDDYREYMKHTWKFFPGY